MTSRGAHIVPVPLGRRVQSDQLRKSARRKEARIHRDLLEERKFLEFVAKNPGKNSKEVYRALGTYDNPGSATRDVLKDEGLIEIVKGPSDEGGIRTYLFATQKGLDSLQLPTP